MESIKSVYFVKSASHLALQRLEIWKGNYHGTVYQHKDTQKPKTVTWREDMQLKLEKIKFLNEA